MEEGKFKGKGGIFFTVSSYGKKETLRSRGSSLEKWKGVRGGGNYYWVNEGTGQRMARINVVRFRASWVSRKGLQELGSRKDQKTLGGRS